MVCLGGWFLLGCGLCEWVYVLVCEFTFIIICFFGCIGYAFWSKGFGCVCVCVFGFVFGEVV